MEVKSQSTLLNDIYAYWDLDETDGNAIDAAGNWDGTVYNIDRGVSGKIGTSYYFDGNSDYVNLGSSVQFTTATFSFWINITSIPDDILIMAGDAYQSRIFVGSSNNIKLETNTNGQEFDFYNTFSTGTWYHCVLVREGNDCIFYRNGTYIGTVTQTNAAGINISQLGFNGRSFRGYIDEVGIWTRALTSAEVTLLYNSGSGLGYPFGQTVQTYTLSTDISPSGAGSISLSPSGGIYESGTNVSATASASSGYYFTGWTGGATGSTNPVPVTMDADKSITANFSEVTTYSLNITQPSNGTIVANPPGPNYPANTTVTLTAIPASGYQFTNWNGNLTGSENPETLVMNDNKSVSATFSEVISGADNLGNHTATQNIRLNNFWLTNDGDNEGLRIDSDGNVGIGTANPSAHLTVNGKILAKEVEVVSSITSDFVFMPGYPLMSLPNLEVFLKKNYHLPGIPSAEDFKVQGQNLGEMDDLLLRKIEELTLYIIEQNKDIDFLKQLVISQGKEIEELKRAHFIQSKTNNN